MTWPEAFTSVGSLFGIAAIIWAAVYFLTGGRRR